MELLNKIKKREYSPLYLLYGNEHFLINEAMQELVTNVLTEEEAEFNFSTYDMEETPIELAIEDAETYPFMGEKKLVILHNPVFLTSAKQKEKVEHDLKRLESYILDPAPYTISVFAGDYEKLDERKKITKLLKKHAEVLEAKQLNEGQLKSWIKNRAALNGTKIEEAAVDSLLHLAGSNLMVLNEELVKLSLYASDTKVITEAAVEELIPRSLEQNVFSLIDKVVKRELDEALRMYHDLLKQNEEPIKILSLIAGQFRLIYQVKEMTGRGYGQKQVAGMLKVHPFRVKLAAGQARFFSNEELQAIMNHIAECDLKLKSGGLDRKVLIELLLIRLNQLKK